MSEKLEFEQIPSKPSLSFGYEIEVTASIEDYQDKAANLPIEDLKNMLKGRNKENEAIKIENAPLKNRQSQQEIENYEEIEKDEIIQSIGYENFTANENIFARLFFLNYYKLLSHIKKTVYAMKKSLSIIDFPLLSKDEQLYIYLEKTKKKLILYSKLTKMALLKSLFFVFSRDVIILLITNIFFMALVGINSIILKFIIVSVGMQNTHDAFMWTGVLISLLFIKAVILHNSQLGTTNFSTKLRLVIISLLYTKLEKISFYNAQKANLGKIINIISGDMNTLEIKMLFMMFFFCIPVTIFTFLTILSVNFGVVPAFASILPSIIVFSLSIALQKSNENMYRKRNHYTDERIKLANEVIEGIRLIKMYGWERPFKEIIDRIRNIEIKQILRINTANFLDRTLAFASTFILAFILFIVYYSQGNVLSVDLVFSTLQLFDIYRIYVFMMFGTGFQLVFEVKVILQRIIDVLEIDEQKPSNTEILSSQPLSDETAMQFSNYDVYWSQYDLENNKPVLKKISTVFLKNKTYAIIGKVGSGKTSFLYTLLHEIPYSKGHYYKNPLLSIAYVEQEPFIMAASLRANILFGKPLNSNLYKEVIYACALHKDFLNFENGDLTEVGEKGVTLSGGQRARISLARALYSEADIYLLDDPLSAIDAKVVRHVFRKAIKEKMKGKCVILVTHQIQFIEEVDEVVLLNEGSIEKQGKPNLFVEIIEEFSRKNEEMAMAFDNLSKDELDNIEIKIENYYTKAQILEHHKKQSIKSKLVHRKTFDDYDFNKFFSNKNQLYKDEGTEKPEKTFTIILRYLKQLHSPGFILLTFIFFVCAELARFGIVRIFGFFSTIEPEMVFIYNGVLIVVFFILCFLKFRFVSYLILRANNNIHHSMFHSVIRTTIEFFDTNPTGRTLNRFSNDINIMDNVMNLTLGDLLDLSFYYISMLVTIFVLNPYFLVLVFVTIILYISLMRYFYIVLSDSKKIDLANKSPIFAFFSSTVQGLLSIKIYKKYSFFQRKFMNLVHHYARSNYMHYRVTRTFAFSIEMISITFTCIAICLLILIIEDSSYFGMCLIYVMLLGEVIQWFLRQIIAIITIFNSVDRALAFTNLPNEGKMRRQYDSVLISSKKLQKDDLWDRKRIPSHKFLSDSPQLLKISTSEIPLVIKQDWPQFGGVIFNNVFMKYRAGTPMVLKGLSFSIAPGEKVGCVGRTGAGKSSITQALFRLINMEKQEGSSLKIDGVDIRDIGLHTLRHSISIIPQLPFVFSGTIRRNLDPLNEYTDEKLWDVLEDVELKKAVEAQPEKLLTDMTQSNAVFSTGQKQLICLARAILKNNKILILDEATANVDLETDKFIQTKIKEKFNKCTMLTIAHRILTIANYDKVLVLEKGMSKEFDHPFNLLVKEENDKEITQESFFAELVRNTGEAVSKQIFDLAREKYFEKKMK